MKIPILPRRALVLLMSLLVLAGVLAWSAPGGAQAQDPTPTGEVSVTKEIVGNQTTVDAGVEFTYLLNYKYASITSTGSNVTLVDKLDVGLSGNPAHVTMGWSEHIKSVNYDEDSREVTWTFVDPLPAGISGQLELKVRFPNGSTAPDTVAPNKAVMDADNADPFESNTVNIAANASCGWSTRITGPATAMLDTNVTYPVLLEQPNPVTGNLNIVPPSSVSVTLPVNVLPGDVQNAAGGTVSGAGTAESPTVVTWSNISHSVGSNFSRDLVIRYDSTRFTVDQVATLSQSSNLTVVGGGTCGGNASQSTTLQPFVANASGAASKGNSDNTNTIIPGTQPFNYTLDAANNGNVPLDNFIIDDALPQNFALTSITLPTAANAPVGNFIKIFYRLSNTGATEYEWTGSPFPAGVQTLPVSALNPSVPAGA